MVAVIKAAAAGTSVIDNNDDDDDDDDNKDDNNDDDVMNFIATKWTLQYNKTKQPTIETMPASATTGTLSMEHKKKGETCNELWQGKANKIFA